METLPPWLVMALAISTPIETFILAGILLLLKFAAADRKAMLAEFRTVRDMTRDHDNWIKQHDRWAMDRVEEIKSIAGRLAAQLDR